MGPIDYLGLMPQVDLLGSIRGGLQIGSAFRDMQDKRATADRAQQLTEQYGIDLQNALKNPTAQGFAALVAKYPGQREAFKQSWDLLSQAEKDGDFNAGVQAYSAITSGRPEIAKSMLDSRIAALEGGGKDATQFKAMRDALEGDPKMVAGQLGLALSSVDPDRWSKIAKEFRENELAPFEKQIKQSEAGVAEEKAILGLEKTAEDIRASKENSRIKAMEAALGRETNELKRQELQIKIDEAKQARDTKVRERDAEAESAVTGVDNTISLLRGILGDEDTLRAAVGSSAWRGALPGTKARTMAGKIEQLKNVTASINLDKLKGAMSDKDIEFLKNMETNLDRYQNEDLFIGELNRVFGNLVNARERIVKKYGVSGTPLAEGETVITGHPKYGDVSMRRAQLLAQKAGMSVEEVMQFLREGGGK